MKQRDTTRVTVLSPSGRGAVAVVAVEGDEAVDCVERFFHAANGRSLREQPVGRIVYGQWGGAESSMTGGEDLVVCRRSPDCLEVHCHGGRQSPAQIVADLTADGGTLIDADEWLLRHHACPLTASAQRALARATTCYTATVLLEQYHGALRRELEAIDSELSRAATTNLRSRVELLTQRGQLGQHLTEPWHVVIAGQPNVGKSSLVNALVGFERSIVFDQPGTTRDIVSSTTAIGGWPVELSDTAGLREAIPKTEVDRMETAGIGLARQRLTAADLIVWVLDRSAISFVGDLGSWKMAHQQAQTVGVELDPERTLVVVNKIDLAQFSLEHPTQTVGTSAVSGEGIAALLDQVQARLVPDPIPPGAAVPFTVEQDIALRSVLDAIDNGDVFTARLSLSRLLGSPSPSSRP